MYEGNQWTDEEIKDLQKNGLVPYVSNQIAPRINNVTGSETVTRTRMKFTARSNEPQKIIAAQSITDLMLYLQENNNSPALWSQGMLRARVSGLTWHHIMPTQDTLKEEFISSLEGIWDPTDRTMDFSQSRGMGFVRWYSKDALYQKWPNKKEEIEAATVSGSTRLNPLPGGNFGKRMEFGRRGYWDSEEQQIMLVHFYYRVPRRFYTFIDKANQLVNTFYEAVAEESKGKGQDIAVNDGWQVRQCVYAGDILFDEGEYPYQLNYYQGWYPMTALCLNREENTGLPYGLVRAAKDDQKLFNKTRAKIDWFMRARQIIMEPDAADPETVNAEAARPDGIILVKPNKRLEIQKNLDEVQAHAAMLPGHIQAIERNLGIFDEAVGAQTNASSGKAIQLRKSGSQMTQAMFLDLLRSAKRAAGRKMATLAQMKFDDEFVFSITGQDGKVEQKFINQPKLGADGKPEKDPDGNVVREADIRQLDFDVFLDEAPDVASASEEARQRIAEMMGQGVSLLGRSPGELKALGIPENSEIFQEVAQGLQSKLARLQELEGMVAQLTKQQEQAALKAAQGAPAQPQQIPGGAPAMPAMLSGGVPGNNQ